MTKKLSVPALFFLFWLFVLTFVPFLIIFSLGFLRLNEMGNISFLPTFQNYIRCLNWSYVQVVVKTVIMAGSATACSLVIGFPVAYYLSRCSGRTKQLGLILLFIPFWTNFILRIYGLISLFGSQGLINQIILGLGITNKPVEILFTRLGVFIGLVYNYLPFLIVPIYSALEKMDPSIKEAAADLGASRFQTFFLVTVPNVKEAIVTGSLFVFIPMLGEYVIPDLLGGAKEIFLGNILVNQFFVMQDWPFGSAIAGILSMLLLVALAYQYYKSREVTPRAVAEEY